MTTNHWNPELVARLEAERAQGLPRWQLPKKDTPDEHEVRRRMLREIARRKRAHSQP